METEFRFTLSKPIKYAHGGADQESDFITLHEPSYKHMDKCIPLKQAFFRAGAQLADNDSGDAGPSDGESTDMTAENLMSMFYMSDEDMVKIMLHAVELFKMPGIAMAGGEQQLKAPMIDTMSNEDLEKMTGEYILNFIVASVLKNLQNS